MKQTLLATILLFCIAVNQAQEKKFNQDIATIHMAKVGLPEEAITSIELIDNTPVASTASQSFKWNGSDWKSVKKIQEATLLPAKKLPKNSGLLLATVVFNGKVIAGTSNGLYIESSKNKWEQLLPVDKNYSWSPKNVAALVVDSNGNLWIGADQGVGRYDGVNWKLFTGKEGLPYNHFTCATAGLNGIVWFGTEIGAIRVENDYFYYRFSRRWLPNDHVNTIAVDENGTAWVGTNNGVGQIDSKVVTLEEKATHFTKLTEDRHNRLGGFIAPNSLKEPFNIDSYELGISDNDGMYTSMYGAAQAFRYAVTGDKEAKELADRSFKACKWLVDITHESGFPARVIIPIDYREPVNEIYSREYNKRHQKVDPFWKDIFPRFPLSEDGKYRWKCDTSSDELAGHFFFYGIYYDLVAETEEEKAAVREVVGDITDHLVRNGFMLRDHDGKSTRWGNFSPDYFNSVWGWDQRGLNSLVMLSFLNVASHVTGDPKYEATAKMLRDEHHYHINAMHAKEFFPPENVVPWDNNISLMSMYGLYNYEEDPELLLMYRKSLEFGWLHISKQKNAFWNAIYGGLCQKFVNDAEKGMFANESVFPENRLYVSHESAMYKDWDARSGDILETLQRTPYDLVGYEMDNMHRLDVLVDQTPAQKYGMGWRNDGYAVPVDERGHVRLDRDGFALLYREVGGGRSEQEGTFYLLPYYMAMYHNLID